MIRKIISIFCIFIFLLTSLQAELVATVTTGVIQKTIGNCNK